MDLGKPLRRSLKTQVWPHLEGQGFTEFSDLAAWRKGDRWIDCVQIQTYNMGRDRSPRISGEPAMFSVDLGCYYTDLHLLPWTGPAPERPRCGQGEGSRNPTCDRIRTLARSFPSGRLQATLFPLAEDGSDLSVVVEDALEAIRLRGIAWLDSTHDIERYLTRVGASPASYSERTPAEVELTEDERREFEAWWKAQGFGNDVEVCYGTAGMPESLREKFDTVRLEDHTAMDATPPYGDLYYALLIGNGRREEAIAALRRDSDPALAEQRYVDIIATSEEDPAYTKRWANRERKYWRARLQTEREHLAMLESPLQDSD